MRHWIENRHGSYYLAGKLLIVFYPGGDVDVVGPRTKPEYRLRALYDFHQCNNVMRDGDVIVGPSGKVLARVNGVHVEAVS